MTVQELIDELQKFGDKTSEVVTYDGGRYSYMFEIDEVYDSERGVVILHEGSVFVPEE